MAALALDGVWAGFEIGYRHARCVGSARGGYAGIANHSTALHGAGMVGLIVCTPTGWGGGGGPELGRGVVWVLLWWVGVGKAFSVC